MTKNLPKISKNCHCECRQIANHCECYCHTEENRRELKIFTYGFLTFCFAFFLFLYYLCKDDGKSSQSFIEPHSNSLIIPLGVNNDKIIEERNSIKTDIFAAGASFFAMLAYGAVTVEMETCNTLALAAILGQAVSGAVACVGAYVIGATASAVSAGMAAEAGQEGWQWFKGSGVAKRDNQTVSMVAPGTNMTLYGGQDHTGELVDLFNFYLGEHISNVTFAAAIYPNVSTNKREEGAGTYYTWTLDRGNFTTTVFCHENSVALALTEYKSLVSNSSNSLSKRTEGEWMTYNTYGLNVQLAEKWYPNFHTDADNHAIDIGNYMTTKIQPCDSIQCYGVQSKMCAAIGYSSQEGVNSAIVGEIYVGQYGGIDNECDSL